MRIEEEKKFHFEERTYTGTSLESDHLTKLPIGSCASQIAISETSRKWPPKPDIKGGRLREVSLYLLLKGLLHVGKSSKHSERTRLVAFIAI